MRLGDRSDWFDIWYEDRQQVLNTMVKNMAADLDAGYNYFGSSIIQQRHDIKQYKEQMDREMDAFKEMDEKQVNRWCFYDLKKRGVIE